MTLFRRSSAVSCYYCLNLVDPSAASSSRAGAFDPSSFRCPYCACWNRYDARGQIVGDEPAMHDERLNFESFSKRGSPDRNQLPSLAGQRTSSLFCRACQTNQTLLINLRAAYLPAPEDPSYATRVAQLPAYVAALQTRYPPVCASCQPAVDAEIAKKDEYARTRALGGALKVSARPPSRAGGARAAVKSNRARLRMWRIRGVMWTASLIVAIFVNGAGALQLGIPPRFQVILPILPLLVLASVAWSFWDPTYSLQQTSRVQGRQVRVGGRQRYIVLQSLAWISRLSTSVLLFCSWLRPDWDFLHVHEAVPPNEVTRKQIYFGGALALELFVLILSYFAITIHKPAPIRLIDTSAHRALSELSGTASSSNTNAHPNAPHTNSVQPEPDLFATLSLSSNPVITPVGVNPMFGQPSLAPGHAPNENNHANSNVDSNRNTTFYNGDDEYEDNALPRARARDPDAMDWEPATPVKQASRSQTRGTSADDGTWLRQQRFFPPEEPTGLESLLMRARLIDEDDAARHECGSGASAQTRRITARWHWGWVYSASVLPVAALLAGLWLRS